MATLQLQISIPSLETPPLDICSACRNFDGGSCAMHDFCANARGLTLDRVMIGLVAQRTPPRGHNADWSCGWETSNLMDQNICCDLRAGQPKGTLANLLHELDKVQGGEADVAV